MKKIMVGLLTLISFSAMADSGPIYISNNIENLFNSKSIGNASKCLGSLLDGKRFKLKVAQGKHLKTVRIKKESEFSYSYPMNYEFTTLLAGNGGILERAEINICPLNAVEAQALESFKD